MVIIESKKHLKKLDERSNKRRKKQFMGDTTRAVFYEEAEAQKKRKEAWNDRPEILDDGKNKKLI